MDPSVRDFVRRRAADRCEYCHLRQEHLPFSPFQIEHIVPRKHGGDDDPRNLALACDRCNAHKGVNLTGIDPETLFNPRVENWDDHFGLADTTIVGLTAVGRTTVRVLNMNEEHRVRLRATLKRHGEL